MYDLSISLFGTPQIKRGEQPLSLQRRKDLALLVYLVVTKRLHSRDILAALLWPDSEQSVARANLRKNLSRLRSDLGEGALSVTNDQVGIHPDLSLWLDVHQFQAHVDQLQKHSHVLQETTLPLCESCHANLKEAVNLYRGQFLEGFNLPDSSTFEEWQFFQAEGYRQNLGEVLQYLIQQSIFNKEYHNAIEYGRKWLSLDNLHEPAHRQLILAYALDDQQSAALRQYQECVHLLKEELNLEPEPETVQLFDNIQAKKIKSPARHKNQIEENAASDSSPPPKIRHNLPHLSTPFVGRKKELDEIKSRMEEPSCRLVTLLGPGGSGKTRLAIQTGSLFSINGNFPDGIWFIHLAHLTEYSSIIPTIQKELNIPTHLTADDSRRQLFSNLHGRDMLLILDNFEHLLGQQSITFVTDLLANSPQVKVLITSRERLNIQGEYLFPVEGLAIPTDGTHLSTPETDPEPIKFGALLLFEQSARKVQPSFSITPENIEAVTRICQHVQGMPLAIELAASWVEALSVEEISHEIMKSLDFLESGLHDIPDRQRSLRAVFDTSWEKLNKSTRSTIKVLSIFRSGFTREAAMGVTCISVKVMLELVNKSWLQPQANGRYQIHELLRQFAFEKLTCEAITFDQVREQYCTYYIRHLAVLWKSLKGPDQAGVFKELESEFENIRTAWTWLISRQEYETAVNSILPTIFSYAEISGKSFELVNMIEKMLAALEASKLTQNRDQIKVALHTAQWAFWSDGHPIRYEFFEGVYPTNMDGIQDTWSLAVASFKLHELGFWGVLLAFIYGRLFTPDEAIHQLEQAHTHLSQANDQWLLAIAKLHLARLLMFSASQSGQEPSKTVDGYLHEALDIFNALGDRLNYGHALRYMGDLHMRQQKLKDAIAQWQAARLNLQTVDVNEWAAASSINWQIGDAYIQMGNFEEAYKCFHEISQTNLEHGFIQQSVGALSKESFERARHGDLADAIRIRKQCLELIRSTGFDYQIAWNEWEMGELMRLAGSLEEAAQRFGKTREIFERYQDGVGLSFYWRGMGDLSLLKGDYETAKQEFSKSAEQAHKSSHNWATAYALHGLGKSELGLKDISNAEKYFAEAISLVRKVHDPGIALVILAGVASLFAETKKEERAIELAALASGHFAGWNETKTLAAAVMDTLKHTMLPRKFNDLKKKGQRLDIWETVDHVIDELKREA